MPLSPHESHNARISCDPTASSPAPVHQGPRRGYFADDATRLLLGLGPEAVPLNSGTYGEEEPGVRSTKLSLLRQRSYDQLLLPFVPKNHWYHNTPLSMYVKNQQYAIHFETRGNMADSLNKSLIDAQLSANESGLRMPDYAQLLVPKLRYNAGGDDRPFYHQFLIFFSPSAMRIRAVRIGRICAILDALTNLAQALQGDPGEWEKGTPVGICVDVDELTEEDRSLVTAYRSLNVPVEGILPEELPLLATADQARTILFGSSKAKASSTEIPDQTYLSGDDEDALDYARIHPDHDAEGLNAEGKRKTVAERRVEAEDAFIHEYQEARAASTTTAMEVDPAPPYAPPEPPASEPFGTSALQVSLGETGSGAGSPQQTLTPISAVTSIQSSEGASAASSASASSAQPGGNRPHRKSTVAARRSDNWRGRSRQQSSSNYRPPSPRHRSPSPRRRSPPPRDRSLSRRYQRSPPRVHEVSRRYSPRRRSPPPDQFPRRGSPPRSSAVAIYTQGMLAGLPPGATIVQTRQRQQLVHETDSGILASVPLLEFSASGNALPLPTSSGRHPVYPPVGRAEEAREASYPRYQRQSRSPARDHRPRRRSPSPRDSRYGSSRYSPPQGTRHLPPANREPRRGRRHQPPSRDPAPAWNAPDPRSIPLWGESMPADDPVLTTDPSLPSTTPQVPSESNNKANSSAPGPSATS